MSPPFLRINGVTRTGRRLAIAQLRDAVNESGGWITDFHLFSNHSICINFEIAARDVPALASSLASIKLLLSDESADALAPYSEGPAPGADLEVAGTLQVSFVHDEPDLRIEVPPIPG